MQDDKYSNEAEHLKRFNLFLVDRNYEDTLLSADSTASTAFNRFNRFK